MADKESTLAIVIRTVDQATAGIRAINDRIKGLRDGLFMVTAPARLFGERLAALGKEAGVPKLVEGFKGVGGALKGVGGALKELGGKLLMIGGVAGAAVAGLVHLVGEFDDLGDLAERLGVNVDFLAQMRYAAERSGATVEQLDGGLQAFTASLGQARAGSGRMAAFLKEVSPALLAQLKAAKSNEQAFNLLADAMAKLTDPAKRAALAQKTVGDAALAPLLARGSRGILELRGAYAGLAGSQEGAAAAAGAVDDSMKDLKAATDGIKAALVEGLSPALGQIVEELKAWFAENRERIAEWAAAIGEKLPSAIHSFVEGFLGALDSVQSFIEAVGGVKTVAIALAAVIVGPLVASFVPLITSVYSLGVAIMTTPIGWILAGLAALAVAVYEIYKHWDGIKEFFGKVWDGIKAAFAVAWEWIKAYFLNFTPAGQIIKHWEPIRDFFVMLWDGIKAAFSKAWDFIKGIVDKVVGAVGSVKDAVGSAIDFLNPFSDSGTGSLGDSIAAFTAAPQRTIDPGTLRAAAGAAGRPGEAKVVVDFANAPRGTRVTADPRSTADVDLSVGYQMGFAP
ncbi:MAG TPA: hypothetical protein VFK02_06610 [Kofleriaceae bacterium]|nr:hypothetical protein [Kofleriaceae bacterium]